MVFLFKRTKSPSELIKLIKDAYTRLDAILIRHELLIKIDDYWLPVDNPDLWEKAKDDEAKLLEKIDTDLMKALSSLGYQICTCIESNVAPETLPSTIQEIAKSDLLAWNTLRMDYLSFETRKGAIMLVCCLLRIQHKVKDTIVHKLIQCPYILMSICSMYPEKNTILYGMVLRECFRIPRLAAQLIEIVPNANGVTQLFPIYLLEKTCSPVFDISSEVIATFKALIASEQFGSFLEKEYKDFFERIDSMLRSSNYITKRQALKLLHDIFLEKGALSSMARFIASPQNLQIIMILLRDKSKSIQFEAFNIFKIFIANPSKPQVIMDILIANKSKMIPFLEEFLPNRKDDQQFCEERNYLVQEITALEEKSHPTPNCPM